MTDRQLITMLLDVAEQTVLVRRLQQQYFQFRTKYFLSVCKKEEAKLDAMLQNLQAVNPFA